jgi:DNA-binding CsgD family transcriptional regulator
VRRLGTVDTNRLNAVARRLGEAVVDPGRWPVLMEEICGAVSTTGAALLQGDIRTPEVPKTPSIDDYLTSYFKDNIHIGDIRAERGVPLILAGRSIVADQHLFGSEREMLRDPLYAHAGRWGLRWWAGVGFYAGSALWALALQRTMREGPFEASELKALGSLPARLTETASLSKAVGQQVLSASTNALDLVRQPAIALDRQGHVIEINSAAAAIFGDELRIRNRRLFLRDRGANSAIEILVDRLRTTDDTEAFAAAPIVVKRDVPPPLIIRVLPVDAAARSPFLGARAILVFTDLKIRPGPEPDLLRRAFNLTAAEARLAAVIATGVSTEEAAERLAIARETARKQLKSVFEKTGVHRQGELVALLSRF